MLSFVKKGAIMLKKALLSIFLVVLVFAVVGCNVVGGSNVSDDQISDGGDTPIIPDDEGVKEPLPEFPDDPYLPNEPDKPSEPIVPEDPKPEEPSYPVGPELPQPPKEGTLFYHVNELAENVDETPEFEIREDNTTMLSNRPKLSGMPENSTEKDITNPANNENYAEYISADRYFWGSEHALIKNANVYIDEIKSIKAEIISAVRMLGVWVKDDAMNCRYRISYDQVNDVAYLEKIADGSFYTKITSTYLNGKMVIDAYQYQPYDQEMGVETSCHYEEDRVLYYYHSANVEYKNLFMLTADLSLANPVNVCLSYDTMDQGDRIGHQMFKYLYRMATEEEGSLDVYNTYHIDDLFNEFNNFSDTIIINNSNDDYVFSAQYSEEARTYFFIIDMYELEGYDKIIRGDSQYKIIVGEDTFTSANSNEHGSENSICYDTDDLSAMAYVHEYGTVNLCLYVAKKDDTLTESRALTEFLDYMGLSFKDESVYDKLELLDDSSNILSQYTYFDYSYSYYVSPEEMDQIYANNKWTDVSYSEIMDMLSAPSVDILEQVEDEEYYALYAGAVSGRVSYNADDTLNLSQITITLGDSGLLTSGEEYGLVAYLSNGYETYPLDKASVTFAGVPVSIYLNDNVSLPVEMGIGKYYVITYLATIINGAEVRLSSITTLEGESEWDEITTTVIEDNSYIIRVTSNEDGLQIAKDTIFTLNGQASFVEESEYLNLSAICGSLSNGYVLLPTDYVCLSGIFYNESDNPIAAIEDAFYFGTSSLSTSLSLDEMLVLNEGTYTLKIKFSVVTEEGEVIFEADHYQTESISATVRVENREEIDAIALEVSEGNIIFKYVKVIDVNLAITYENDIIDTQASTVNVLYPPFFEGLDDIGVEICFTRVDDETISRSFTAYGVYELLGEGFPFLQIDLTCNDFESGTYKVGYRIIVSNSTGVKLEKYYETDITLDLVSAMPEQGEEIIG